MEDPSRLFPSGQKREVWNRRNFKCDFLILRNQLFFFCKKGEEQSPHLLIINFKRYSH